MLKRKPGFLFFVVVFVNVFVLSVHSQNDDASVMAALKKTLNSPSVLQWDDSDICKWKNIGCSGGRVSAIRIGRLNLQGSLPKELAQLTELQTFECNNNGLTGPVPYMPKSLLRLSINNNNFNSMPNDFFKGMTNLKEVRIDYNPFSRWNVPDSLQDCASLTSFSGMNASFVGKIPGFFGKDGPFQALVYLALCFNYLEGGLPGSFSDNLQNLLLNGQQSMSKLNGTIAVLQNMTSLQQIWIHGNSFTGPIPDFSKLSNLTDLSLRDNQFTGVIPPSLTDISTLKVVNLTNNYLQGSPPKFDNTVRVDNDMVHGINRFCTKEIGQPCSPLVNALLSVVEPLGYPIKIADSWKGNDPCVGANNGWLGIVCSGSPNNISLINFQNMGFSGKISPKFASLTSVTKLLLGNNNLTGIIPSELASMPQLKEIDVSNNNLYGKIPSFPPGVVVKVDGNPNIGKDPPDPDSGGKLKKHTVGIIVAVVVGLVILIGIGAALFIKSRRKKIKHFSKVQTPDEIVVHPHHSEDGNAKKKNVAGGGISSVSPSGSVQKAEAGNMAFSIQLLREVTGNFNESNILGKGGFGTVYKGELHDGTKIAVKRMESGIMGEGEKGLSEFKSEIAVLTKVRHRHLVALLGHCLDGNERLLVYEHMPQGPLSKHLFECKEDEGSKPLEWKRRLIIALDVARGVEYLHGLAQQIFIHRDLKPSNILLGDDMRAKVSDFGLVRLVPEGQASFETRLAGTFGYLAPEYAVTGRVTTKVDVYSYGVILMEMITGRKAIDNSQPEENVHLVTWFRRMLLNRDSFQKIIDPALDVEAEALDSFRTVAELAGHCCAREPHQRPDMSNVVNVLAPLVEIWKPSESSPADIYGLDLDMSLPQALQNWQALEGMSTINESSSTTLRNRDYSQSSLPPAGGFANSFNSMDAR